MAENNVHNALIVHFIKRLYGRAFITNRDVSSFLGMLTEAEKLGIIQDSLSMLEVPHRHVCVDAECILAILN